MTTLRQLHEELNITQRLSLYVKNQNKKYKPNEPFTADGELSKTMETLIRINTLGKLGRHMEQAQVMSASDYRSSERAVRLSGLISEKAVLESKLKSAEDKAKRAESIVNNANMRDYIIELYKAAALFRELAPTNKTTPGNIENLAKKYTKSAYSYLNKYSIAEILEKEAIKLSDYLKEKEGK